MALLGGFLPVRDALLVLLGFVVVTAESGLRVSITLLFSFFQPLHTKLDVLYHIFASECVQLPETGLGLGVS